MLGWPRLRVLERAVVQWGAPSLRVAPALRGSHLLGQSNRSPVFGDSRASPPARGVGRFSQPGGHAHGAPVPGRRIGAKWYYWQYHY